MTRLFFNIGHNFRIRPQDFVGAIANEANIPGRAIGAIDIHDTYSFVDVPTEMHERVIRAMNASAIKGRPVSVEVATEPAGGFGRGPRGPRRGGFDRGPRRGGFDRGPRQDRGRGGFNRDRGPRRDRY